MQEDLLKIINHYGINNQLKKLNEEVFELIEAIREHDDNVARHMSKEHVEEEFADVMTLLGQFKHYYELNDKNIKKIMQFKRERQLERMKEEK